MIRLARELSPVRVACLAVIVASPAMMTACNRPHHSKARVDSQQRWNEARAAVKHQLARQQYQRGLFDEVITTVAEALSLDPTQVSAYVLLARANLELSKPASAMKAVETAFRLGLDSPDLQYTQGVILELRGQLDEAADRYARARNLDPTNVDFLVAHVECLVELDREPDALALLEENANAFDDSGALAVLAGRVALLLGDESTATRRYSLALETLRGSPTVSEELGLLLARSGRCAETVALLDPLVQEAGTDGPDLGAVRRALAACHLSLNDPTSAQDALLDYARSHPRDGAAQLLLAKAAVATDDLITATRAVDLAQRWSRAESEVKFVRATVQWRWGDLDAALTTLDGLLEVNPNDPEAQCLRGEVLASQQRVEESANAFYRALKIDPSSTWAASGLKAMEVAEDSLAARESTPQSRTPSYPSRP